MEDSHYHRSDSADAPSASGPLGLSRLLGTEAITSSDEETFLLFTASAAPPSQNLGFLSSTDSTLALTVAGLDLEVSQSPGLLTSNRAKGTTGAVLWTITPLFAEWLAGEDNILFKHGILTEQTSLVVELGCGISGVLPTVMSERRGLSWVATDLHYVMKTLRHNISTNLQTIHRGNRTFRSSANRTSRDAFPLRSDARNRASHDQHHGISNGHSSLGNIDLLALDWESSDSSTLPSLLGSLAELDAVVACDCIYNEALIEPFVRTCAEICALRTDKPVVCVVAQQLRSDEVFEAWLARFMEDFAVWRVPDGRLTEELRGGSGYVVHVGVRKKLGQ
jgi:hypothetical protein